jgi:hypothetical protein
MRQSRRAYGGQRRGWTSSTSRVLRVAVAKVACQAEKRRDVAWGRDALGTQHLCVTRQVGVWSRYRCDTVSGRVPRGIGDGVGRVEGEIWKRLEETTTKSGGEGKATVGSTVTKLPHLQRLSKSSQLDDWSNSPQMMTKASAATVGLPALTGSSVVQTDHPKCASTLQRRRPLTRAFACLELNRQAPVACRH